MGAGYGGTLATWFRQRYPDKVNGVWASSAPLLAQVDFSEFMHKTSQSIEQLGGEKCSRTIEEGFAAIENLILLKDGPKLKETFYLCYDIDFLNNLDAWHFVKDMVNIDYVQFVQYYAPGLIEEMCEFLTNERHGSALQAVANWFTRSPLCQGENFEYYINFLLDPSWNAASTVNSKRQWMFQKCNEFGWFKTAADPMNQIFGSTVPLEFHLEICKRLFKYVQWFLVL